MDSAELRTQVGVADLVARYQFLTDSGKTRQVLREMPGLELSA